MESIWTSKLCGCDRRSVLNPDLDLTERVVSVFLACWNDFLRDNQSHLRQAFFPSPKRAKLVSFESRWVVIGQDLTRPHISVLDSGQNLAAPPRELVRIAQSLFDSTAAVSYEQCQAHEATSQSGVHACVNFDLFQRGANLTNFVLHPNAHRQQLARMLLLNSARPFVMRLR